jgi:hypothetical protein
VRTVTLLQAQGRTDELERLLTKFLAKAQSHDNLDEYLEEQASKNLFEIFAFCNSIAAQQLTANKLAKSEFFIENALIFGRLVPEEHKGLLY